METCLDPDLGFSFRNSRGLGEAAMVIQCCPVSTCLSETCLCANTGVKRDIRAGCGVGNPKEPAHSGGLSSRRAESRTGWPKHSKAKYPLGESSEQAQEMGMCNTVVRKAWPSRGGFHLPGMKGGLSGHQEP